MRLGAAVQRYLDGDRDLAMRSDLARRHLAAARAALSRGDGEAERAAAMREAGRALALDPTAADAATLVGSLMLQPPPETPRAVEAAVESVDRDLARGALRLEVLALAAYALFLPCLIAIGVRDWFWVGAAAVMIVTNILCVLLSAGMSTHVTVRGFVIAAVGNGLLIFVFARIGTPFLVAPGLAVATIMAFAFHPRYARAVILWVVMTAAVLAPVALEHLGVFARSAAEVDGSLVLTSPTIAVQMPIFELLMAAYVTILLAACAVIARTFARGQFVAQRSLQLQAWHLRQLSGMASATD